jgi:DNA-binding transcriptional LysR family regulator
MTMAVQAIDIQTRELRVLVEVMRQGSFAAAGPVVGLSADGVAKSVQRLEKTLGFSLFARELKGVSPTPRCRDIFESAKRVLSDLEKLAAVVEGANRENATHIRVACLEVHIRYLLAEAKKRFEERETNRARVDFVIIDNNPQNAQPILRGLVRDGNAEIAVGGPADSDLRSLLLYEAALVAVTWPNGPWHGAKRLKLCDLSALPVAIPRHGFFSRQLIDRVVSDEQLRLNIGIEARSTGVMLGYGELGLAIPILSEDLLPSFYRSGRSGTQLVPITDADGDPLITKVHLHVPKKRTSVLVRDFIDITSTLARDR